MIKISNITRIFENRKRKTKALDNVNITFESKGLCFIVGASGAGKTTLLNILSLQDKPTTGNVQIDNVDVSTLNHRSIAKLRSDYFGIVFQNLNLIADFSVYQNIVLGLEIQKKPPQKEDVIAIFESLNLPEEILEERVYNLSGGQRQRVAIARALIKNSKVIICDEPTGSLDEDNSIEIMKILKKISKDRLVIVVSHNDALSKQYGDRIISLKNGAIKSDTNPINTPVEINEVEIKKHTRLPFKFVLKIALSSFKKGIPKFVFTLISFVLTLAVFLVSVTISSFNADSVAEKALKSENVSYFDLVKYEDNGYNPTYFNENDLKILDKVYKDKYILSYSAPSVSRSTILNYTYKEDREFYNIKNIVYLSSEMLEKCNFKIIGSLPKLEEVGVFEIALTKYDCYNLGWIDEEQMNDEAVFQEIINNKKYKVEFGSNTINPRTVEFNISGIIDTNYLFLDRKSDYNDYHIQERNEMHNNVFFPQQIFEMIMGFHVGEGEKAYSDIYVVTEDKAYLKADDVISKFEEQGIVVKRHCKIDFFIQQCGELSDLYGKLSFVISMILLGISLFSFVGFIRFSIEINKKKMKVLRSLGITMLDSNNIFSLQAFFITLVCVLLAVIPYTITIFQLNAHLKESWKISLSILNISFTIILLSFIGLLCISVVITTIINALKFNDKNLKITEEF